MIKRRNSRRISIQEDDREEVIVDTNDVKNASDVNNANDVKNVLEEKKSEDDKKSE